MNGLVIDTPNSGVCTQAQAFSIPVPAKTRTYAPVANQEFFELLMQNAATRGLKLQSPQFGLARKMQRMFGCVEVVNSDCLKNEVSMMLGFRNSYDGSLSVGICFGSKVFVCSNMCFSGYAGEDGVAGQFTKRHVGDVFEGIQSRIDDSLNQFDIFRTYQETFYKVLQNRNVDNQRAHDLIIRAARHGAINTTDIITVADEWAWQRHAPEEKTDREWYPNFMNNTAFSLFNMFTQVHKGFQKKNPLDANFRSIKLTEFFHKTFMN